MDDHGPVGKNPEGSHKENQMNGTPLPRRPVLERVWVFHPEEQRLQRDLGAPSST